MTQKRKGIYAGTFDPLTNGHLDIVRRSLKIFDEVTILIAVSPTKKPLFSKEERLQMLTELFEDEPRVNVEFWSGLVIDYAKENGISGIIRGLRPTGDFEIEFQMASMNKKLYDDIETVFFTTTEQNYCISSSLVKEVLNHGGDIEPFVPAKIFKYTQKISKN